MDSEKADLQVFQQSLEKKFLTCYICYDILNEPKILTCLHTYCKLCLKKHIENNGATSAKCPLCAKTIQLPVSGIEDLPNNFYVVSLIDEVRGKSKVEIEAYKSKTASILNSANEQIKSIGLIYIQIEQHCQSLSQIINHRSVQLKQSVDNSVSAFEEFCKRVTSLSDQCKEKLFTQQEKLKQLMTECEEMQQRLSSVEASPGEVEADTLTDIDCCVQRSEQLYQIASEHIKSCKHQAASFLDCGFFGGPDVSLSDLGVISHSSIKINETNMKRDMQEFAISTVCDIYQKLGKRVTEGTYLAFADLLCKSAEGKYGGNWECAVGLKHRFGCRISTASSHSIQMTLANLKVFLYKCNDSWFN